MQLRSFTTVIASLLFASCVNSVQDDDAEFERQAKEKELSTALQLAMTPALASAEDSVYDANYKPTAEDVRKADSINHWIHRQGAQLKKEIGE